MSDVHKFDIGPRDQNDASVLPLTVVLSVCGLLASLLLLTSPILTGP